MTPGRYSTKDKDVLVKGRLPCSITPLLIVESKSRALLPPLSPLPSFRPPIDARSVDNQWPILWYGGVRAMEDKDMSLAGTYR